MGWWSYHPMGGDDPLNAKDTFFRELYDEVYEHCPPEKDELEFEKEYIQNKSRSWSVSDLEKMISDEGGKYYCDRGYGYALPYALLEYECFEMSDECRNYLKNMLEQSLWMFCRQTPLKLPSKPVSSDSNRYFTYHMKLFYNYFDDAMTGKMKLDGDCGLLAAMMKGTVGK